jgi:hypothetical protein
MRWKLLIAASLVAAVVGAGVLLLVGRLLLSPSGHGCCPPLLTAPLLLPPVAATAFASVFVYRHTARRRPLQALATAVLSLALTFAALIAAGFVLAPRSTVSAPSGGPAPGHVD